MRNASLNAVFAYLLPSSMTIHILNNRVGYVIRAELIARGVNILPACTSGIVLAEGVSPAIVRRRPTTPFLSEVLPSSSSPVYSRVLHVRTITSGSAGTWVWQWQTHDGTFQDYGAGPAACSAIQCPHLLHGPYVHASFEVNKFNRWKLFPDAIKVGEHDIWRWKNHPHPLYEGCDGRSQAAVQKGRHPGSAGRILKTTIASPSCSAYSHRKPPRHGRSQGTAS